MLAVPGHDGDTLRAAVFRASQDEVPTMDHDARSDHSVAYQLFMLSLCP
jgi:hypothetical protein